MSSAQQPINLRLPPLSELDSSTWQNHSFYPDLAPREWLAVNVPGFKAPQCAIRTTNKDLFTGIYYSAFAHSSVSHRSGVGERASRVKQVGSCLIVIADTPDNGQLLTVLGTCATKKLNFQLAIVDCQEELQSSTGWAVEGLATDYGRSQHCFYIRIQAFGHCTNRRQVSAIAGAAFKASGNLVGQNYDYSEVGSSSKLTGDLHKFLQGTLTKLVIPK